jgi:hypothetical protein
MITSEQLARQMAVFSYVTKTKNVGSIAQLVGLSPLQITNAVFAGDRLGLFTVVRDKKKTIDKIEVSDKQYDEIALVPSNFGEAVENLVESIYEFVRNRNSVERDVEEGSVMMLARVPDVMWTVASEIVKSSGVIRTYEYADALDKKSIYTYFTLPENKDKLWYHHDFKKIAKKTKK